MITNLVRGLKQKDLNPWKRILFRRKVVVFVTLNVLSLTLDLRYIIPRLSKDRKIYGPLSMESNYIPDIHPLALKYKTLIEGEWGKTVKVTK